MQETYKSLLDSSNPAKVYTLEDFVSLRNKDNTTYRSFSILEKYDNNEFVDHNLFDEYIDIIERLVVDTELTDEEMLRYKYAPDLLAYDIYGSVQLDYFILLMNGMVDYKEFNKKKIKMMRASVLRELMNEVAKANSGYIAQNRADYGIHQ